VVNFDEPSELPNESSLDNLVAQFDFSVNTEEYLSAYDDLATCFNFEEGREELRQLCVMFIGLKLA